MVLHIIRNICKHILYVCAFNGMVYYLRSRIRRKSMSKKTTTVADEAALRDYYCNLVSCN